MNALQLEGLARHYGEREALVDVSLSLPEGQTLVVFGANGAGKTTLLRTGDEQSVRELIARAQRERAPQVSRA